MTITLENISKKYNRSWIFRDVNYVFYPGGSYAILGSNGSGKSTLLQIISGFQTASKGQISYQDKNGKPVSADNIYSRIGMATPYMELPEEFTLQEMVAFHGRFKKSSFSVSEILQLLELDNHKTKEIKDFSSGMKQRLKLGLALFFESDILLLDEPATNLDTRATDWYRDMTLKYQNGRTLIISSNQEIEYDFCADRFSVEDYKK